MNISRIVRARVYDTKAQAFRDIDVDVEANLDAIGRKLAGKAFRNRSRVSREIEGCVVVRVRRAHPLDGGNSL
jgi:hypothetical protein